MIILIDPLSNATVGAAMIQRDLTAQTDSIPKDGATAAELWSTPVTTAARYGRHGHQPAVILVEGRPGLAEYLERALFADGFEVMRLSADEIPAAALETVLRLAQTVGQVVILTTAAPARDEDRQRWKSLAGERFFDLAEHQLQTDDASMVRTVLTLASRLRTQGK